MKRYPAKGGVSIEYRVDGKRMQRCSLCHATVEHSPLLLRVSPSEQLHPVMVGADLVGVLCQGCVPKLEMAIQHLFPDSHAFPFVDERQELMPTPRCEHGHALVFSDDGLSMVCPRDNEHQEPPGHVD